MRRVAPATAIVPPTSRTCSGGTVARVVAVREPRTSDTGIGRGTSGASQTVLTSRARAFATRFPSGPSIRRIRTGGDWSGTREPTCSRRSLATDTDVRVDRAPSERTAGSRMASGRKSAKGCVQRH